MNTSPARNRRSVKASLDSNPARFDNLTPLYSLELILTYDPQERIPLESGSRNEKGAGFKPELPNEA